MDVMYREGSRDMGKGSVEGVGVGGSACNQQQQQEEGGGRSSLVIWVLSASPIATGNICVGDGRVSGWDLSAVITSKAPGSRPEEREGRRFTAFKRHGCFLETASEI